MKYIFTTIEYVAKEIKEAITGHKNDEQAHPNLSEQINVLSKRNYYTLADFERTEKFNTIDDCVTAMGSYGSAYLDTNLCFTDMSIFPSANGVLIVEKSNLNRTVLTCLTSVVNPEDSKIFMSFYRSVSTPSYSWKPVSTTDKTDISLLNGWRVGFENQYGMHVARTGNLVNIIACITGGTATVNTVLANVPIEYRPKKVILGYADTIGGGESDARFLIMPDGNITLNTVWNSSLTYQISFTYPIE